VTLSEIYDLPVARQREAIRDWHEATARINCAKSGWSDTSPLRPADDIIDGYLESERLRRQITGQQAVAA
jgi:hypothetical protein